MADSSENEYLKRFGQNLKAIRKSHKLSLEMLANMADVDMSGLHRIEKGKTAANLVTILRLAKALAIKPSALLEI